MMEETLDVEPDLLVNTMPPPSGGWNELDMLPFDEVLNSISQRPSDLLDTRRRRRRRRRSGRRSRAR